MATSDDIIDRGANKAKAAAAQANDQFNDLKDSAVRAAHTAADTVKSKLHDGQDYARSKLHDGQDYVNSKLHDGQEYVSDAADRVRARSSDLLTDIQDHIEHNPLQAIAIAAGVGVVLGVLLRRR